MNETANETMNAATTKSSQMPATQAPTSDGSGAGSPVKRLSKKRRKALRKRQEENRRICQRRDQLLADMRLIQPSTTPSNRKSPLGATPEEEAENRFDMVGEHAQMICTMLSPLLKHFKRIKDPRDPRKTKHQLVCLLLYGLLGFVYQMHSRRDANRRMTAPQFMDKLKRFFPEIDSIPHGDTLANLLTKISPADLEAAHFALINKLLKNKLFATRILDGYLTIAIDGTEKHSGSRQICSEQTQHTYGSGDAKSTRYSIYVVEAIIVLPGLRLPLASEFLSCDDGDPESDKQDCELKGVRRLTKRIKAAMPRRAVRLLADGLYANGPIMQLCRSYNWDFMIVLKDKSLTTVWQEFEGLDSLGVLESFSGTWRGRTQTFKVLNDHVYRFGKKQSITVSLVVCTETEVTTSIGDDDQPSQTTKEFKHAWLSSKPITQGNVEIRCNCSGRQRWQIEESILDEKHRGYAYEHLFSHHWNAIRCFHLLMRTAHLLNELALATTGVAIYVRLLGSQAFVRALTATLEVVSFAEYRDRIDERFSRKRQLRLIA